MSNRYTGRFDIVANPDSTKKSTGYIARLELRQPEQRNDENLFGIPTQNNFGAYDRFTLSERFKSSNEGFKHQLLTDINGITPQDADLIVRARNALLLYSGL